MCFVRNVTDNCRDIVYTPESIAIVIIIAFLCIIIGCLADYYGGYRF